MGYDAYWAVLDWKALAGFAVGIGTLAGPFLIEWWKGKAASRETAAKIAESAAERVERQAKENYDRVLAEREYAAELARQAASAVQAAQNEAADRRREGRGMEDWAHWFRHEALNALSKAERLVSFMQRWNRGEIAIERVREVLAQLEREPIVTELPQAPLLQDAFTQKPPR